MHACMCISHTYMDVPHACMWYTDACQCVGCVPVGLEVLQPGLQVVQQVDLLAALGAVDVHLFARTQVTHLARSLARTAH